MTLHEKLTFWSCHTTSLAQLCEELMTTELVRDPVTISNLATRVARSVLVDPTQRAPDVSGLVERFGTIDAPAMRLALLDLVNALKCVGAAMPLEIETGARRGLGELSGLGPPLALRIRVGFAAIVYGELDVATGIAYEVPELYFGDEEFPNNLLALLGYLVRAASAGSVSGVVDAAWYRAAAELPELCANGQLDEPTVLWLARVVYERFAKRPTARVAALAHEYLWGARERTTTEPPAFPLGDSLGRGAYRIENHLRGRGAQTLWHGRDVATGAGMLVACDGHTPEKQDIGALRRAVSYQVPGMFELAYVGPFDTDGTDRRRDAERAGNWATVEKVTAGSWLPSILGPADPWAGPAKAIHLGRSAGRILVRAATAGINITRIRPELMWADRPDGHLEVTGLSPRATELFARKVGELVTYPLFDRFYHAPEIYKDPDDRAVAYSLAVMIAEWATGRYPFASRHAPNGVETGIHAPIAAPAPLARLLEATIRPDRNERPRLHEFVGELERLEL